MVALNHRCCSVPTGVARWHAATPANETGPSPVLAFGRAILAVLGAAPGDKESVTLPRCDCREMIEGNLVVHPQEGVQVHEVTTCDFHEDCDGGCEKKTPYWEGSSLTRQPQLRGWDEKLGTRSISRLASSGPVNAHLGNPAPEHGRPRPSSSPAPEI